MLWIKQYLLLSAIHVCLLSNALAWKNKGVPAPAVISSPNGAVRFSVSAPGGVLQYAVSFNGNPAIELSRAGLTVNQKVFGDEVAVGQVQRYRLNESYAYRGVHNNAVNACNAARININSAKAPFVFEARVYNDGVAFRYLANNNNPAVVEADLTSFQIPAGSIVWSQSNIKYYEGKYSKNKIEDFKQNDSAGPPITVALPGNTGFAAITEGGLTDFAGMSLIVNGERMFKASLAGTVKTNGKIETPWRIIMVGKDLNTLVNSDLVANVSPAFNRRLFPLGYNTQWIKPGRSVWSWLAESRSVTLDNMKRFTDLAAELGFEYNLVDEGWGNWKDSAGKRDQWDMMKELVDYSKNKNVKIWVWKAYPDRRGIPGIKDPEQRKAFFKKCKELGIAGLKVDFFDSESQEIINFYQAALKDAADYQLMMNFHGANKPTGEARTWPNEMTREAVRGLENRPPWAQSNTILPFTRYLAGHGDYTPVHLGNRLGEVSWAHHVASMVVFTSPFLCIGADPQSIINNPAKELIQKIPPTWDETIVLSSSKIGELVVYARRKGNNWYLAVMNGIHEPTSLTIGLSFLAKGNYNLASMKDDKEKQANALFENKAVTSKSSINIELNPEGGFVGMLEKTRL